MIAIILAGGEGSRAGGGLPKQFRLLCGRPLLWWSMRAFRIADPNVRFVVVVHPGHFDTLHHLWNDLDASERFAYAEVCGGRSRVESVHNALIELADGLLPDIHADDVVAVHDAARPLVSPELISRGLASVAASGPSIPVVALSDSIRRRDGDDSVPEDRSRFVAVQTPQLFPFELLKSSYDSVGDPKFTDDASIVQQAGHRVSLFDGETDNMKVTNPSDFYVAEVLLSKLLTL